MKILCISIFLALLCACGGALDQGKCMESVQKEFPDAKVHLVPNNKYRFLVEESTGTVWWVETLSHLSAEVTAKYKVID